MCEALFHPFCKSFATAVNGNCAQREHQHDSRQDQGHVFKSAMMFEPLGSRGDKGRQNEQERKSADVKDAFDCPDGKLRRKRKIFPLGDQIGTDKLARTTKQRQSREAHNRGRHQSEDGSLGPHRAQEKFPAHCSQEIGDVNECDTVKDVKQADAVGLRQEEIPVEVLPGAELHVDKSCQHHEHNPGNRCAFLVHEEARILAGGL